MDNGGGSSRFSTPMRKTEKGGENGVLLDKPLKKEKVRRLSCMGGEMDQLSPSSIGATNSTSKRVKLPKKCSGNCCTINHYASAPPRKLRSALKNRQHESRKICDPVVPDLRNEKDSTKKHKSSADGSKECVVLTKDEEAAAEALFALGQTFTNTNLNGPSQAEPSLMPVSFKLEESTHNEPPPNEAKDSSNEKKSQKRCWVHVYICRFIKDLQSKELGLDERARVNVISDTNPPNKHVNDKVQNPHKGLFQEHQQLREGRPHAMRKATCMDLMGFQNHHSSTFGGHLSIQQEMPYDIHQSQWSANILPKQQHSETGCYQNWQNQRHNTTPVSSIQMFGSVNKGKMQCSDSSGYDKGSLFLVDSGPKLELTL